uniref:Putative salivary secreted protein n=1 Tax=Ornithodoros coriaceus TaxID=92741 RepID=B2D2F8_ORNCO|nr:putative salivary secreted protein [Ornithodoros coriaceus]
MRTSVVVLVVFVIVLSCGTVAIGCSCDDSGCHGHVVQQGVRVCTGVSCYLKREGSQSCCRRGGG